LNTHTALFRGINVVGAQVLPMVEKALGVPATARNRRTVGKVLELARSAG